MNQVFSELWLYTLGSVFAVSLVAFVGVFTLSTDIKKIQKIVLFLVSLSAGTLLGDAFIHLLPEVAEEYGFGLNISMLVLTGILLFFIIERFVHFHHCHHIHEHEHSNHLKKNPIRSFAIMNLIGDAVHNFTDGMIIAASFMVSAEVGVATTLAVILHEIPQEIGDFGVLIHAGVKRTNALWLNFGSALFAVLGAVLTLIIGTKFTGIDKYIIPIAAGGFIYIACTDLIPELHKETSRTKLVGQFAVFLLGIGVMWSLLSLEA